jgi:hypothetical protein
MWQNLLKITTRKNLNNVLFKHELIIFFKCVFSSYLGPGVKEYSLHLRSCSQGLWSSSFSVRIICVKFLNWLKPTLELHTRQDDVGTTSWYVKLMFFLSAVNLPGTWSPVYQWVVWIRRDWPAYMTWSKVNCLKMKVLLSTETVVIVIQIITMIRPESYSGYVLWKPSRLNCVLA